MNTRAFRCALGALWVFAVATGWAQPIHFKAGSFDPLVDRDFFAASPVAPLEPLAGEVHRLVQFRGEILPSDFEALRQLGVPVRGFIPENTLVVAVDARRAAALAAWERVRWTGELPLAAKLSAEIGQGPYVDPERAAEAARGIYRLIVSLHEEVPAEGAALAAERLGMQLLRIDPVGPSWLLLVRGTRTQALELARRDDVAFVEEALEPVFRNDTTTWVVQSNQTGFRPIWARGLRGEGQIVGLIDGRLDMNHWQFRDPVNNTPGPNHRKVVAYNTSQGADSHGTHCAGTIAGDLEPMNGQTTHSGHAPKARLVFNVIPSSTESALYSMLQQHHGQGARVHSNSWGNDSTTSYTAWCRAIDRFSWDFETSLVVFAATNTSTLKTPENAKNVLAVGATQQAPNQGNHSSGGTGPTADGRRKPEIYAPGAGIFSAASGTTTGFRSLSGTSMACPAIAGSAALVRQYFVEGWHVAGVRNPAAGFEPTGALLRAMLMNSTVDMTGVSGYPSNREGWGRLWLDNVLWFRDEDRRTLAWEVRNASGLTAGESREYLFVVRNRQFPLRITMTFTDFPASVNANPARVNNVDLAVYAPNGSVFLGNVIDTATGRSVTGGSPDINNTTEMVILNPPPAGVYRVVVSVPTVNQGSRQGFALVVNGGVEPLRTGVPQPRQP